MLKTRNFVSTFLFGLIVIIAANTGCTTDITETSVDGIEIQVFMPNGLTPIYNGTVIVSNEETSQAYNGTTGLDGMFVLSGLEDGTYKLYVDSQSGLFTEQMRIEVTFGRSATDLELPLKPIADGNRFSVVEGPYDDVHSIFAALATPHLTITPDEIISAETFDALDVLVIESGAEPEDSESELPIELLKTFVNEGGTLILTDRTYSICEQGWPNKITFPATPEIGKGDQTLNATVMLPAMTNYFQSAKYPVKFDMPDFAVIESTTATVLLTGTFETAQGTVTDRPILVSFNYGEGKVVYSSFNFGAQLDDNNYTKRLFTYLIANTL